MIGLAHGESFIPTPPNGADGHDPALHRSHINSFLFDDAFDSACDLANMSRVCRSWREVVTWRDWGKAFGFFPLGKQFPAVLVPIMQCARENGISRRQGVDTLLVTPFMAPRALQHHRPARASQERSGAKSLPPHQGPASLLEPLFIFKKESPLSEVLSRLQQFILGSPSSSEFIQMCEELSAREREMGTYIQWIAAENTLHRSHD